MSEIINPKQAAMELVESYVMRGDSLQSLRSGQQGCSCEEFRAMIGGYLNGKKYGTDKIIVREINGRECEEVFSLSEIFYFIKGGQQNLI